jgi:hypothetical protein
MIALLLAAVMQVTFVEGPVTVAGVQAAAGSELHEGDTVQTGGGGRVEISLAAGSIIRLGENSRVTLQAAQPQRAFSARLFVGNLWTKVHKLIAGERFEVETENGVAGVRGTEFRVEATAGQPDLLRVYEGVVKVGDAHVEAGRELRFRSGEKAVAAAFDAGSEKGHRFMDWVRSRPMNDGGEPGDIHRPDRNPERENRLRDRRDRKRDH